jgi:transcriptional antiterminator NusG
MADEVEEKGDTEKHWYILKVQSNRETTICDGLKRRAKIAGIEEYFGDIIVPTEMVTEFKNGKKRVVKRKLYPGYIIVNMQITDQTWFLVRETPGIGDFTGSAGRPVAMDESEISRFLVKQDEDTSESPKLKIAFNVGDRVKINDGTFENFEGSVDAIDQANGRVTVMTNIFGRSTPVELEYWQIEVL